MKKFVAFLFAFIFGGLVSFLVFNNNMFLTLLVSQNKDSALNTLTQEISVYGLRTYRSVYSHEHLILDSETEDQEMENFIDLKLITEGSTSDYMFIASVTKYMREDETESTTDYTYYFKESVLYIFDETNNTKTMVPMSYFSAMSQIAYNPDILVLSGFDTESEFKDFAQSITPAFSFSPFYLGLNMAYTEVDEGWGQSVYTFTLDMFSNLRGIDFHITSDDQTVNHQMTTSIKNYNGATFELTFPDDLSDYVL